MWRVTGGLAVTVGLVTAMLVIPSHRPSSMNGSVAAAQVREALSKVNSWHLKGWRLIDGRQLVWEVWGRRNPFFYREQIGDRIVVDDGKYRIQIVPPDPTLGRPGGIFLKTPAFPDFEHSPWLYDTMARQWRGYGATRPWKESAEHALFRSVAHGMVAPGALNETIFTVDKQTLLPVEYELRRTLKDSEPVTAEILKTVFNKPVPDEVMELPDSPTGYNRYDATEPPSTDLPRVNAASARGITVQVQPLSMDRDGVVLASVRGWLGNLPLRRATMLNFYVEPGRTDSRIPPGLEQRDDKGRSYLSPTVLSFYVAPTRSGDPLMLFAPLEPFRPGSLPRLLHVALHASISIAGRASGTSNLMSSTQLVKVDVPIRVTLPAAVSRIDIDSHLEPGWRDRVTGIEETPLAAVIARTRASHYHWLMNQVIAPAYGSNDPDYQPKGEHPERIDTARLKQLAARSALWAREAITHLRPQSKERRMERQRLLHNLMYAATWLRRAGDKAAAAGILSEILRECKKFPEGTERLRRKAEDELAGLN